MHLFFMQNKYRLSIIGIILLGIITFSFTPSGLYVAQAQGTLPFSENFSTFTGAGFDTTPAAGQLDSDTWRITGMSDGAGTFGGTHTAGDFARGTSTGGVTTGGTYAFNVGAGNIILGIQPIGTDFNPGTITLRIQNTTGSPITDLNVGYDIFYRNDQPRANSLNFRYSSDDVTYTAIGALDFTTPAVADMLGWQSVARSTTITGLNVPNGSFIYLQWRGADVSGAGNRDEYGIDNVSVTLGAPTDTPPTVASTLPTNGATGVLVNSTITITFSEAVDISAGGVNVECPSGNPITFSGLPANTTSLILAPTTSLPYNTLCSVTVVAANVVDIDIPPDNMAANYTFSFTTEAAPIITRIHDVQGNGSASPIVGSTVTVEAVVIGDFQGPAATELRGFFIQEEDGDRDADPMTSEGLFVFCSACPDAVNVGDIVRVTGTVSEFQDMTQITASTAGSVVVQSVGNPLPAFSMIDLPVIGNINDFYEPLEGMLVRFNDTLTVSEYFELARYGQITLYEGGRPYQFTHNNAPNVAGYTAHLNNLASRRIILDDLNNTQNAPLPNGVFYHPQPSGFGTGTQGVNYFRGGDTVSNLTGILHWSFAGQSGTDAWRIRPIPDYPITFTPVNTRPSAPTVTGDVTVASFNVLNYFTTLDTGGTPCGPTGGLECRGADSADELTRQTDKLVTALQGLDADIFGLIEIQNTSDSSTVAAVVTALNAVVGAGTYDYINTGAVGTDAITNAFIYKSAVVQPVGGFVIDADPIHDRPPLAVLFEVVDVANPSFGARFYVVVNHFKSKGSPAGLPGDTDQGDGQAQSNATRVAQANQLIIWINTTLIANDPDVLIIGDLNAYRLEDPITALIGAGYTDLVNLFGGTNAYGYLFDGQLGYLDHALANASLLPYVTGTTEWHINADEVPVFDYNNTMDDGAGEQSFEAKPTGNNLYEVNPYRTSDHDPVLVGLTFPPLPAPIVTNAIEIDGAGSVVSTNPAAPVQLTNTINSIAVTFSTAVQAGTGADGAENPDNYILLAEGSVAGFQTTGVNACQNPVDAGDTAITFTVTYNSVTNTATLNITGASPFPPLTVGKYSLIVCGSTSIVSAVGNIPLNNGTDVQYFFDIVANTVIPPVDPVNPNPNTTGTGTLTQQEILATVTGLPATGETPLWADTTRNVLLAGAVIAVIVALTGGWIVMRRRQTR